MQKQKKYMKIYKTIKLITWCISIQKQFSDKFIKICKNK